ncbi:hypothetical protein [Sulfuricurvum sp.]
MPTFLNFTMTGDPTFDFFFSLPASLSILFFLAFSATAMFRGRV